MWPALAILGGLNLGMGALKSAQAEKQRKMEADLRAAEVEASPWTGRGASTAISTAAPNIWADLLGAGLNTAGQYAALSSAGAFNTAGAEGAASQPPAVSENPYTLMYKQQMASPVIPYGRNSSPLNIWEMSR